MKKISIIVCDFSTTLLGVCTHEQHDAECACVSAQVHVKRINVSSPIDLYLSNIYFYFMNITASGMHSYT